MIGENPVWQQDSVATVIVSRDRHKELEKTVLAVLDQSVETTHSIIIIDSSMDDAIQKIFSGHNKVRVIRSTANLGGAGGFALGILSAIAMGADWVWLMDDDGRPNQNDALERLLFDAKRRDLDAVAPIVLDAKDELKFAFPYPIKNRYIFDVDQLPPTTFIPSVAHLFNAHRRPAGFR